MIIPIMTIIIINMTNIIIIMTIIIDKTLEIDYINNIRKEICYGIKKQSKRAKGKI